MNKKGFTIVELVIVIAVIAILAAVLIPTFSGVINKANQAKDTQLVRNLNTSLALDVGVKHNTMQEALDAVAKQGYDLDKINASAMQAEILWDSHNDAFVYLDGEGNINYLPEIEKDRDATELELWQICKEMPAPQEYSIYAGNGWDVTSVNDLKVGFDAGKNTNITSVNYVNSASGQSVVIRTNGGTLTINAPSDTVNHYGYADSVNVIDVATASYHENGEVKFLEVAAGHIVLEADAEVSAVHFTATVEGDAAKFENAEGKKISIDLSKVEEEKMPSFSRDAVTIEENGTYVAEVKTDSTEYIWLFGNGIKEQMVVTTTTEPIAVGGELKEGITTGAEDGSVAEQIANPAKRNAEGQLVNDNNEVVSVENAVVEEVASKESVQIGATLFAGGTGTESDPFLIYDYATMQNIQTMADLAESGEGGYGFNYYYKVKDGITVIDCCEGNNIWKTVDLYGHFDGNGVTFNNLVKQSLFNWVEAWDEDDNLVTSQVKNFTVNANIVRTGTACAISYYTRDVVFSNITVHGYVEGGANSGLFVAYGPCVYNNEQNAWVKTWNATFENCSSDATMVNTNGCASQLIGHPACAVSGSAIYINNFSFTGNLYSNNANGGRLYSSANTFNIFYVDGSETATASNTVAPCTQITVKKENLPAKYSVFTVNKLSGYDHAIASLIISPNDTNETGGFTGTYMVESSENNELVVSDTTISTTNLKYFDIQVNGSATVATKTHGNSGYSNDGKVYNIVNSGYGTTYGNASVRVVQYNSQGNIIGISIFTLPVE